MKSLLIYRINTETERLALDFHRDFQHQTGKTLELLEADSPEGAELARLYDIVDYPAVLAMSNDGRLLQLWQGQLLPRISEVSYFVESK